MVWGKTTRIPSLHWPYTRYTLGLLDSEKRLPDLFVRCICPSQSSGEPQYVKYPECSQMILSADAVLVAVLG